MDFQWFLDSSQFVTRDHCGTTAGWTTSMANAYQLANILIAMAYFSIPFNLLNLYINVNSIKKIIRRNMWIVIMFSTFIFFCGVGHMMDVMSFYYAPYRLFVLVDILTAVSSVATAIMLPGVLYDTVKYLKENH